MFKQFTTSIFSRRQAANSGCQDKAGMTQSELQDLFRSEFEVHNRSAIEITSRHMGRRLQAYAA